MQREMECSATPATLRAAGRAITYLNAPMPMEIPLAISSFYSLRHANPQLPRRPLMCPQIQSDLLLSPEKNFASGFLGRGSSQTSRIACFFTTVLIAQVQAIA